MRPEDRIPSAALAQILTAHRRATAELAGETAKLAGTAAFQEHVRVLAQMLRDLETLEAAVRRHR